MVFFANQVVNPGSKPVVNMAILKLYTEGLGNDRKQWTIAFYLSDRSTAYLCFATGILVRSSKEIQGNKRKIKGM